MKTQFKTFSTALLAASLLGVSATASAVLLSCPTDFTTDGTAKVYYLDSVGANQTAASACQYMTPADTSSVANLSTVNSFGFFGTTTWLTNGQTQVDGGGVNTGSWSISGVDFTVYDYIIVFKDGQGTNLTAFLLNEEVALGSWSTPFTDPPFDLPGGGPNGQKQQGVSHWSIFKRDGRTPPLQIPEPGMLLLMGAGLVGLGLARRRKAV